MSQSSSSSANVLWALFVREIVLRRKAPFEAALAILEPLFIIAVLSFSIWLMQKRAPHGSSVLLFLSTGLFPLYLFVYCGRRMRPSSPRRRYPVETLLDQFLLHIGLGVADFAVVGVILFPLLYLFAIPEALPFDMAPILLSISSVLMIGFGFAIVNRGISKLVPVWSYFSPAVARVLMLFSGVHYIVDHLPPQTRTILSYNPLLHSVELFRQGFYPKYPTLVYDGGYLAEFSLCAVTIGLVLERIVRRME